MFEEYFKWLVLYKEFINQDDESNSDNENDVKSTNENITTETLPENDIMYKEMNVEA